MTLEFHPYVLDDVRVAAAGYEATSPAMSEAFLAEVSARLGKIQANPDAFPNCGPNTSFRRAKLWRFPQSIVYRVEESVVYVSLIAHAITNEEPGVDATKPRMAAKLRPPTDSRLPA